MIMLANTILLAIKILVFVTSYAGKLRLSCLIQLVFVLIVIFGLLIGIFLSNSTYICQGMLDKFIP